MIRPDYILHDLPVSKWTDDERLSHLKATFRMACDKHPDLMERYMIGCADVGEDGPEMVALMRIALRETVTKRFPSKFAKQTA